MCSLFFFHLTLFSSCARLEKFHSVFNLSNLNLLPPLPPYSRLLWIIWGLSELKILRIILFKSSVIRLSSSASRELLRIFIIFNLKTLADFKLISFRSPPHFHIQLLQIISPKFHSLQSSISSCLIFLVWTSYFISRFEWCFESARLRHILVSFNSAPLFRISFSFFLSNWVYCVFAFSFLRTVLN